MRAWTMTALNQPAEWLSHDLPIPKPGEARIRIRACALNFADLLMAQGRYQERPALPFVPGLEFAGTIEALGPDTDGPDIGSRVAAFAGMGGLAEAACVPIERLLPIPDRMSFVQAAGFQIAYGTSHLALAGKAGLRAGETLFVTGAAGGVGLTAVEIGHLMGARVIAQVRGEEKAALVREAGADEVIAADHPDLKAALRDLGGVDVVYDTVGGPGFEAALRAMRPGGRMLAIGFAGGEVPKVPLNQLLVRNVSVIGFWWGGYLSFAPEELTGSLATLLQWYAEGRLRPHVSQVLPFDRLPEGLEAIRSRKATGKIVLAMG